MKHSTGKFLKTVHIFLGVLFRKDVILRQHHKKSIYSLTSIPHCKSASTTYGLQAYTTFLLHNHTRGWLQYIKPCSEALPSPGTCCSRVPWLGREDAMGQPAIPGRVEESSKLIKTDKYKPNMKIIEGFWQKHRKPAKSLTYTKTTIYIADNLHENSKRYTISFILWFPTTRYCIKTFLSRRHQYQYFPCVVLYRYITWITLVFYLKRITG